MNQAQSNEKANITYVIELDFMVTINMTLLRTNALEKLQIHTGKNSSQIEH
jgi:hypothetical protein